MLIVPSLVSGLQAIAGIRLSHRAVPKQKASPQFVRVWLNLCELMTSSKYNSHAPGKPVMAIRCSFPAS